MLEIPMAFDDVHLFTGFDFKERFDFKQGSSYLGAFSCFGLRDWKGQVSPVLIAMPTDGSLSSRDVDHKVREFKFRTDYATQDYAYQMGGLISVQPSVQPSIVAVRFQQVSPDVFELRQLHDLLDGYVMHHEIGSLDIAGLDTSCYTYGPPKS